MDNQTTAESVLGNAIVEWLAEQALLDTEPAELFGGPSGGADDRVKGPSQARIGPISDHLEWQVGGQPLVEPAVHAFVTDRSCRYAVCACPGSGAPQRGAVVYLHDIRG